VAVKMSPLSFAKTKTSVKALTETESQHQLKKKMYKEYSAAVMVMMPKLLDWREYQSTALCNGKIQTAQGVQERLVVRIILVG